MGGCQRFHLHPPSSKVPGLGQAPATAPTMEKSEEAYLDGLSRNSISPERGHGLEGVYLARTNAGEALNPQPSDDPEDPLNWPLGLKVSI